MTLAAYSLAFTNRSEIMFGLFKKKDPVEAMQAKYAKLMEEAMNLQRNGDIRTAATKTAEADELLKQIDALAAK